MWKPEYAESRRAKYNADENVREKRKSQSRAPEENREYMRAYYAKNKHLWNKRSREQQDKINERKREKYKSDPALREHARSSAKKWQQSNPDKRRAQRLKKYGITISQFDAMLQSQGGKCAICGTVPEKFHVDHCHTGNHVRGLLCESCNLGIGKFYDNPESLESAARYLRKKKSAG